MDLSEGTALCHLVGVLFLFRFRTSKAFFSFFSFFLIFPSLSLQVGFVTKQKIRGLAKPRSNADKMVR
jgi:hypothetical protein